ncbi:hypothetical protein Tco_0259894, partial [Tanacetum coccineum]
MIRCCISGPETRTILDQCQHGPTGEHYGPNTTAKEVLDSGFYWPTIIKEAHTLVHLCKACQKTGNISKHDEMPLNSIQDSLLGSRPNWLFDIDALTKSMNYKPVVAGNQSNGNACTKAYDDTGKASMEKVHGKDYIMLPLWAANPPFSQSSKSSPNDGSKPSSDDGKKVDENPRKESKFNDQEKEDNVNNTNNVNAASTNEVNAVGAKTSIELPDDPNMPKLEDIIYSDDDEDVAPQTRRMTKNLEEHGLFSLLDEKGIMIKNKARLVAQGYTQEEGIDYD